MASKKRKVVPISKVVGHAGKPVRVKQGGVVRIVAPEQLPLASINFAPYNPRVMPPAEMRALKASIKKHGMVLNLVVQNQSGEFGERVLIGGHQRVTAMRELCKEAKQELPEMVWCIVLDVSDAVAKQLNVSLNNIEGEFDPHKLGELLASIQDDADFDLLAIGFAQDEVDELVRQALESPEDEAARLEREASELSGFGKSITLTVEFDTVARRDEAKNLMKALAGDQKAGVVLARLLKAEAASRKARPKRAAS